MADTLGQFFRQPPRHQDILVDRVTPPPPLSSPAPVHALEAPPPLGNPAPIHPLEPAPPLHLPTAVPFEDPPILSVPASIPFEPPPVLSVPASIGDIEPAPPLSVPGTPPFQPPPALSTPGSIPFEPPPPLSLPAPVPAQRAPALSSPAAVVYPPVDVDTKHHTSALERVEGNEGGLLGDLTDVNISFNTSVDIPGLGPVPLDSHASYHGGKFDAGFDLHLEDAFKQRVRKLKDGAIAAGLQAVQDFKKQKAEEFLGRKANEGLNKVWPKSIPTEFQRDVLAQPDRGALGPSNDMQKLVDTYGRAYESKLGFNSDKYGPELPAGENIPAEMDLQLLNDPTSDTPENKQHRLDQLFATGRPIGYVEASSDPLFDNFELSTSAFVSQAANDTERGFFEVDASNDDRRTATTPTDDSTYVPLVFTDLRPIRGGRFRSVYFNPIITSLSQDFGPAWNMRNYFGRVDKVATYEATDRTIAIAFKIVTLSPQDLQLNYKKLAWLESMVYPMFDQGMQYFSGPVVRLRVGDIINAVGKEGNRGVSGVITRLSFDYSQATWELEKDRKMPREVDVSLAFHVLHDSPVGLLRDFKNFGFGGIDRSRGNLKPNISRVHNAFGTPDYLNDPSLEVPADPVPNEEK